MSCGNLALYCENLVTFNKVKLNLTIKVMFKKCILWAFVIACVALSRCLNLEIFVEIR